MSKKIGTLVILAVFLIASSALAEDPRVISLKDGSTIRGNVVSLSSGKYKIKTQTLGIVEVDQDQIESISSERMYRANQSAQSQPAAVADVAPVITQANLTAQVERVQNRVMSDPAMMAEIQTLMNDPQIMSVISDPEFMKKLMSLDMKSIESNPQFQQLLQNPKMLELINKLK